VGNTTVIPRIFASRIVESVGESVNEHECVDESEGDGEDGGETEGEFGVWSGSREQMPLGAAVMESICL